MLKGFIEEKEEDQTMNQKKAKNTNLSPIDSKKQTKQTRKTYRIMDT